ncbi:MAG: hypothetical protein WAV56_04670 [Microgenomates group bacterium]
MRQLIKVLGKTEIPYFVSGGSPTLLIHAGTHGDESGVVDSVRAAVTKYEEQLPDFLFVPTISPSAVAAQTRINMDGLDLNRNFFDDSRVSEVEANLSIVRGRKFDLMATFHEDPFWDSTFYLYDINCGVGERAAWKKFKDEIGVLGLNLLNGTDDPKDPTLNYTFEEGYHYFSVAAEGYLGGSFDAWAIRNGVIKGALVPEIPGKMDQEKKNKVVDLFFRRFLLK